MPELIEFKSYNNSLELKLEFLSQIIKNKKLIPIYLNGKKFFFWVYRDKIFYLSEYQLCIVISLLSFFITIGLKKLLRQLKLKKKTINLLTRLRGGQDETGILRYWWFLVVLALILFAFND